MSQKRKLEDEVRHLLSTRTSDPKDPLLNEIEIRSETSGRIFFVRKGAPIDPSLISPADRVDVKDLHDRKRRRKQDRFTAFSKDKKYKGPYVIAEGDSWFEYPWLNTDDLIDWSGKEYAILSLAYAGATWGDVRQDDVGGEHYSGSPPYNIPKGLTANIARMASPKIDTVMLSVGGNDLIGGLSNCVYDWDPHRDPDTYINHHNFDQIIDYAMGYYSFYVHQLTSEGLNVVLHTYDYPDPRENGQYIGFQLKKNRNFPGVGLMRRVVYQMIDVFHDKLDQTVIQDKNVNINGKAVLVDLRGTIGTADYVTGPDPKYWNDEMHGTKEGFGILAGKIKDQLAKFVP